MNLNHKLMIAIVKRGYSRPVIAEAKKAGADGATIVYGEGIGRNEKPTFLGLPVTHEKDVVFIAIDGENEAPVAEAVSREGKLGKPGVRARVYGSLEQTAWCSSFDETARRPQKKERGGNHGQCAARIPIDCDHRQHW